MPQTVILVLEQKIELNDILDIVFTDIQQAPSGNWIREFRFVGTAGLDQSDNPMTLIIRAVSPTKSNLELTTANLQI